MSLSVFRMMQLTGRALSAQRQRLDAVSSNLANAQTTRTAEGGPYRRRSVVLAQDYARDAFGNVLHNAISERVRTVRVEQLHEDAGPPRYVFEPDHPDADPTGYVAYPNINTVEEMVDMITTMRSYQANLSVLSSFQEFAERALALGR